MLLIFKFEPMLRWSSVEWKEPHDGSVRKYCQLVFGVHMKTTLTCVFPTYKVIAPPANKPCLLWQDSKRRSLENADGNPTGTLGSCPRSLDSFPCYAQITMTLLTTINQQRGHFNSHLMVHVANLKQWLNPPTLVLFSHFFYHILVPGIFGTSNKINQGKDQQPEYEW